MHPNEGNRYKDILLDHINPGIPGTAHKRSSYRFAAKMAFSIYSLKVIPSLAARCLINLLARRDSFICIRTFPVLGRPRERFFAGFCTPRGV